MLNYTKNQRVGLFVDGIHSHMLQRALNFKLDLMKLQGMFERQSTLAVCNFYSVADPSASAVHGLITFLGHNGWKCVTKPSMDGYRQQNIYLEMSVDILQASYEKDLDFIYIISGASGLVYVVDILESDKIPVTLLSTKKGTTGIISRELWSVCSNFTDMADHIGILERKVSA